jgi:MoaA/NifB/PqqE/SkfB family radical SAM enzyme
VLNGHFLSVKGIIKSYDFCELPEVQMDVELAKFKITNHIPTSQCRVEIVITENCTFRCSYCYWVNDPAYSFEAKNIINQGNFHRVLDFMLMQEKDSYHLDFYGGEPTAHPNLIEFIHAARERVPNLSIGMLSNLSKPKKYFENFPGPEIVTSIIASLHTEFVKNIDEWFEKVAIINPEEIRLVLTKVNSEIIFAAYLKYVPIYGERIVVHPVDGYENLEGLLERKDIRVQIDDDKHSHGDSLDVVLKNGEKFTGDHRMISNFKGMLCNAGYHIDMKGDVYPCWSAYRVKSNFLNVFNDPLKKLSGWTLCTYAVCDCGHRYTKYSKEKYLELRKNNQL